MTFVANYDVCRSIATGIYIFNVNICSSRVWLSLYAEIQIIFVTVHTLQANCRIWQQIWNKMDLFLRFCWHTTLYY